jgi:hypothetical protein
MDVNRREKQQLHTSTRYEDIASIGMKGQEDSFIRSLRELQLVRFGSRLNAMFSNVLDFDTSLVSINASTRFCLAAFRLFHQCRPPALS